MILLDRLNNECTGKYKRAHMYIICILRIVRQVSLLEQVLWCS
jgi:hypothetical protein